MTALPSLFGAAALTLAAPAAPPAAAPAFGPPALCHPVAIGDAESLPWGGAGGFDVDRRYDVDRLAFDTTRCLRGSDDVLAHMETVRRAVVYAREEDEAALVHELVSALRRELIDALSAASAGEAAARRVGLAWFDLGYALGTLRQAGWRLDDGGRAALERARELLPGDPAVYLGRSLALWSEGRGHGAVADLDRAVRLCDPGDGLLRENLVRAGSFFFGARGYDELVAALAQRRGGA